MSRRVGDRGEIGQYRPGVVMTVLFDLGPMGETRREEVDERPGFRRQMVAVRIDGIDRRFLRLVVGQKANQPPGIEIFGDEIVRTE